MLNPKTIDYLFQPNHDIANVEDSYDYCKRLTKSHYENFPVASFLVSKEYRKNIYPIYVFARLADDIADEYENQEEKIQKLELLESYLTERSAYRHSLFWALYDTIDKFKLPLDLFQRLLKAFKDDSEFQTKENLQEIFDYCDNSANPVGELILRLSDNFNEKNLELSNKICTGLQLANFWQDFSRDLPNGRLYIPKNILSKYGFSEEDILNKNKVENSSELLNDLYEITQELFDDGKELIYNLSSLKLRFEIALTHAGGNLILSKTKRLGTRIFQKRPKISKFAFAMQLFRILLSPRIYIS